MASPLRALPLALLLLAVGCDGDAPPGGDAGPGTDAGSSSGVRVELGTGTSAFEDIPEGSNLELIAGPQGGWHVWVTARIWDEEIDGLLIDYEAVPVGSSTPISMPTQLALRADRVVRDGDHWLRAGDFVVMDITGPTDIVGMQVELTVRITDRSGRTASDTRTVTIVDEIDEPLPG